MVRHCHRGREERFQLSELGVHHPSYEEKRLYPHFVEIMRNYFKERSIKIGRIKYKCTMGVAQGLYVESPFGT